MKKILILLITFYLSSFSTTFAENDSLVIEKSRLIEKYIVGHKQNIEKFSQKYGIKNNGVLNDKISELNELILVIRRIEVSGISNKNGEEALRRILVKMREINIELEKILRVEKEKFDLEIQNEKKKYEKISKKLFPRLDLIANKIDQKIGEKVNLNLYEIRLKNNSTRIKRESEKLKKFHTFEFKNKNEMKVSYIRILKVIRNELVEVKKSGNL